MSSTISLTVTPKGEDRSVSGLNRPLYYCGFPLPLPTRTSYLPRQQRGLKGCTGVCLSPASRDEPPGRLTRQRRESEPGRPPAAGPADRAHVTPRQPIARRKAERAAAAGPPRHNKHRRNSWAGAGSRELSTRGLPSNVPYTQGPVGSVVGAGSETGTAQSPDT